MLEHANQINKTWIIGLKEHIWMMSIGLEVYTISLPLKQLAMAPTKSNVLFFIKPCPMCEIVFDEKIIYVVSCSSTYHLFYLATYIDILK